MPDLFESKAKNALDSSLKEAITGTLSYNGQRCTALKLLFVPTKHADTFVQQFVKKVEAQTVGLPWQTFGDESTSYSKITPLPNQKRIQYMKDLMEDAIKKGAKIMNKNGGTVVGGENSTLMVPAVLYPVTKDMRIYHEEQVCTIELCANVSTLDSCFSALIITS